MSIPGTLTDLTRLVAIAPYGFDWVNDTSSHSGGWFALVALVDNTSLSTLAGANVPTSVTNMPLPLGMPLTGDFTSFRLASGQVLAYRHTLPENNPGGDIGAGVI